MSLGITGLLRFPVASFNKSYFFVPLDTVQRLLGMKGSVIEIAGVEVGRLKVITLDNYQAKLILHFQPEIKIQEDAILSVKTKGLMGEKYLSLSPGGSEKYLAPGEWIRETEPPIDLEELLAKYIYGKV